MFASVHSPAGIQNEIHLQLMMSLFSVLRFADVNYTVQQIVCALVDLFGWSLGIFCRSITFKRPITWIESKMRCSVSTHFHAILSTARSLILCVNDAHCSVEILMNSKVYNNITTITNDSVHIYALK